jgi:NAD(P)-dependent dehydrogenase (short-subunit alcohol dehydrogenase family)
MTFPPGAHVISGGAGALGSVIAEELMRRGAQHVVVCDLDGERATALAERLGGTGIALDAADPASIDAAAARIAELGPVAGIVHAAGVFGPSSFPDIPWEEWQQALSVHVAGAYRLTTGCLAALRPGSSVVHITSVEAFHVLSTSGATSAQYAASKGGLQMLTRSLAADLGPRGMRVNAVAPGYVLTTMNEAVFADPERRALIEDRIPLGWRLGTPAEIAGPVCFLLSDDAAYVTGQTLAVDGGLTLGTLRRTS